MTKNLFVNYLQDIFINYSRMSIKNLKQFEIKRWVMAGSFYFHPAAFNIDYMDFKKIKEAGLYADDLDECLINLPPERRILRYFRFSDPYLLFSNIFYFLGSYYYSHD
jgi:hypothetical protein